MLLKLNHSLHVYLFDYWRKKIIFDWRKKTNIFFCGIINILTYNKFEINDNLNIYFFLNLLKYFL